MNSIIESPELGLCNIEDFKSQYLFNFIQQMNGQNMAKMAIIGLVYQLLNWSGRLEVKIVSDQFKSW